MAKDKYQEPLSEWNVMAKDKKKICPLTYGVRKDDVGDFDYCAKDYCAWWDDHPDRQQCAIVSLVHLIGIKDELEMSRRQ